MNARALALLVAVLSSQASAPPLARGQHPPQDLFSTPEEIREAERLLLRARGLERNPRTADWAAAAALYRSSASLMPVDDRRAARFLLRAANLLFHAERLEEARTTAALAVERALLMGDVSVGAEASLAAAWLAERAGDTEDLNRHLTRAAFLSYAPLLPHEEAVHIRKRIALPSDVIASVRQR